MALQEKFLELYTILAWPGIPVTLWLLDSLQAVHPVFHVSVMEPAFPTQFLIRFNHLLCQSQSMTNQISTPRLTTNIVPENLYIICWTGYERHWQRNLMDTHFGSWKCLETSCRFPLGIPCKTRSSIRTLIIVFLIALEITPIFYAQVLSIYYLL